jgi:CDP-paratose 2-epimerase
MRVLVTGSNGLIGSEAVAYFDGLGADVVGVDNNMRAVFFGDGCLTGPQHSGVELHGFLSYLVKAALTGITYRVYGYEGKQVRDNIHCRDVCRAIHRFYEAPRPGEVYNLGGGRANSCSILEAAAIVEELSGARLKTEYVDQARGGDHICYISDLRKLRAHYPGWDVEVSLREIFRQILASWETRRAGGPTP